MIKIKGVSPRQVLYVKLIEDKTKLKFKGRTLKDVEKFIKKNIHKLNT